MKKYQLLVAPLLSVAFLMSCNGGTPTPLVDKHAVTEQEFNDACSFKNVQYLQSTLTTEVSGDTSVMSYELSPTISHLTSESSTPISSYIEQFTRKKDDGTYEKAYRFEKGGTYQSGVATEMEFITPQDISVSQGFEIAGLTYKSFTYDSKAGTYSATFTPPQSTETTAVLRFDDKKLTSVVSTATSVIQSTTYAYEEKIPEYPDVPTPVDPYFVTEDEFYDALSFENVTYAQFNTVEDHGPFTPVITRENAQFAPNKFHLESHNFTKGEDTYNCDIYVTKEGTDTYKRYQPITGTTKYTDPYNCLAYTDNAWEVVTGVDATEFKTPKEYVDFSGITYDASAYDSLTGFFEIDGNELQFYKGKLQVVHNTAANMTVNVDYEEYDIDLPDVTTPISYEVDEDVWAAYKDELSPYSDMSTFFVTEEPVTTKNEIKCVYSEDLIYGFLNQSPISNAGTMERYSFHETSYEEPYDIYYDYLSYNSSPFTRTDYDTKEEWFETSFADPTQAMIKMIFDFDKSTFQFDTTNNLYYANDVSVVIVPGETVECDLKVAFINNQLVYTDVLSKDGKTIKEHIDVFAKNSFIEVPEFPEPGLF